MPRSTWLRVIIAALAVGCAATQAKANFYRDLARSLQFAGFQIQGVKNPITQGGLLNVTQTFRGAPIDFGVTELNLVGTVRSQVAWDRRPLPSLTFVLDSAGSPLQYALTHNLGLQDFVVRNTEDDPFAEITFSMVTEVNALGFYDMLVNISNTGEFQTDGLLGEESGTLDFDIGPINLSGHIVADLLAALTDPLYAQAGVDNPFHEFSLRATRQRNGIDSEQISQIEQKVAAGKPITDAEAGLLATDEVLRTILGQSLTAALLAQISSGNLGTQVPGLTQTPEPASILLLAAGLCCLRRKRP